MKKKRKKENGFGITETLEYKLKRCSNKECCVVNNVDMSSLRAP